jgi:hypothetical protein
MSSAGFSKWSEVRRAVSPERQAEIDAIHREWETGMARAFAGEPGAIWPFEADYDDHKDSSSSCPCARRTGRCSSPAIGSSTTKRPAGRPVAAEFLRASNGIDLDGLPQKETLRTALEQLSAEGRLPAVPANGRW